VGCLLSDFRTHGITPHQLIERMKAHPSIKPLIEGGEMKEYSAHLIPEGGYNAIPTIHGEGWMMVGDAGMFVNSVHREGSNLAMTTGRLAAETAIELRAEGKPFTAANLARYRGKLDGSFVMKDLRKYRDMPEVLENNHQFFTQYPELINRAAHTMLMVDGADKREQGTAIRKNFIARRSPFSRSAMHRRGGPSNDQGRGKALSEPLPGRRGPPAHPDRRRGCLPAQMRVQAVHDLLPGVLLHTRGQWTGHADHRWLPRVRHLPRDLQRARERAVGIPARRLRHCSADERDMGNHRF
jgi:hypothetical protein